MKYICKMLLLFTLFYAVMPNMGAGSDFQFSNVNAHINLEYKGKV